MIEFYIDPHFSISVDSDGSEFERPRDNQEFTLISHRVKDTMSHA